MKMTCWIASFDIGKKNFAFCIEEICIDRVNIDRVNIDRMNINRVLDRVYANGNIVLLKNIDLTEGCINSYLDPLIFVNMTKVLDKYKSYWDKCSVFVIEQQMDFRKNRNTMALKLGHHCSSYFIFHYAYFKPLVEFPAYHKTQVLGATKMTKYRRKIWSIQKAEEILAKRNELDTLNSLSSFKKRDDLADTICQLQAFKYLLFFEDKDF